MNAIATRFQVTAAALAVATTAAIAPIAANAAPSVQIPSAPVVMSNLAEAPGDFGYFLVVTSLQLYAKQVAARSAALDTRANRLEAYAAAHPGTFFGNQAAAAAARVIANRAALGDISVSVCRGGTGISVGAYGAVTSGPC